MTVLKWWISGQHSFSSIFSSTCIGQCLILVLSAFYFLSFKTFFLFYVYECFAWINVFGPLECLMLEEGLGAPGTRVTVVWITRVHWKSSQCSELTHPCLLSAGIGDVHHALMFLRQLVCILCTLGGAVINTTVVNIVIVYFKKIYSVLSVWVTFFSILAHIMYNIFLIFDFHRHF